MYLSVLFSDICAVDILKPRPADVTFKGLHQNIPSALHASLMTLWLVSGLASGTFCWFCGLQLGLGLLKREMSSLEQGLNAFLQSQREYLMYPGKPGLYGILLAQIKPCCSKSHLIKNTPQYMKDAWIYLITIPLSKNG